MKKILSFSMLLAGLVFVFIACQKDVPINSSVVSDNINEMPIDKIVEWVKTISPDYEYEELKTISTRTDHCEPEDIDDQGCTDLGTVSLWLSIPSSQCLFLVSMDVQACGLFSPVADVVYFTEKSIRASISCNTGLSGEQIQALYNLFVDQFMNSFISSFPDEYLCSGEENGISSNYSQYTCTELCLIKIGEEFIWKELECATEQGCCIHFKFWCINGLGQVISLDERKEQIGSCSGFFQPEGFCFSAEGCKETECE